jgi:glycosidase
MTEASQSSRALRGKPGRIRIYQLLPRLFGNTNETRIPNGTRERNGVGKFNDINAAALASLRAMHFTHVWLTGVLAQCTASDYPDIGQPADVPDLLKGLAGSPYAIKDYFDVSPDYAAVPAERLREFRELIARIHRHDLRVIIDFVPNHVARSYRSTMRPDLDFGAHDDRSKFFDPQNNFFHLPGRPLRLPTVREGRAVSPTCEVLGTCDGLFDGEREQARVTGNNVTSPEPSLNDWYETVKLNYGYDFTTGERAYPHAGNPDLPLPDTWLKMDAVLAHWQALGVDGFRCDMAHMVPPEFWSWAIARARERQPEVFFVAEAYGNDPMKVPRAATAEHSGGDGDVMADLLRAGFDAVYDDPAYKKLKSIYDGVGWANDLDDVRGADPFFERALRYAENHDEVRLAGRGQWGGLGPHVGRAVSAILFGLSRGPVLLYSGQDVGEPAAGAEGFGGDDARTTIFDYWSMPELVKWVNGHRYDGGRLSAEQRELRDFYSRLLGLVGEPGFRDGGFFALNPSNRENPHYGRLDDETASGHWLYSFLRHDERSGQGFLVVANLHGRETLRDVRVRVPAEGRERLNLTSGAAVLWKERLGSAPALVIKAEDPSEIRIRLRLHDRRTRLPTRRKS